MKLADFDFSAFISYESHCKHSVKLARSLNKFLQGYELNSSVDAEVYQESKIGKIFFDKEYSIQHEYLTKLINTLKRSAYLIVISSLPKSERDREKSAEPDTSKDYLFPNAAIKSFLGYDVDFKTPGDEKLTEQQIAEIRSNPELLERLMKCIISYVIDDDLPTDVDPHAWKERLPHNLRPFIDGDSRKHINRTSQLNIVKCECIAADILLGGYSSEKGVATPLYTYERRRRESVAKRRMNVAIALLCTMAICAVMGDFIWIEVSELFVRVSAQASVDYVETADNVYPSRIIDRPNYGHASGYYVIEKKGSQFKALNSIRVHSSWPWAALRPVYIKVDEDFPQYQNRFYGIKKELVRWVCIDQDLYSVKAGNVNCVHELNAGIERYFDYYDGGLGEFEMLFYSFDKGGCEFGALIKPLSKSPSHFRVERSPDGYVSKRYFLDQNERAMYNDEGAAGLAYEYELLPCSQYKSLTGVYMIDSLGRKCENESGISGVVYEFDKKSRLIAEIRLVDKDGNVRENAQGVARIKTEWDGLRLLAYCYYGADVNQKKEHKEAGVHRIAFSYDKTGSWNSVCWYNAEGEKCENRKYGAAGVVFKSEGNEGTLTFIGVDNKPIKTNRGFAIVKSKTDEYGRLVEISLWDERGNLWQTSLGVARECMRYNQNGRMEYDAFFDAENKPCASAYGVACYTEEYESLENGRERSTRKMFASDGKLFVCSGGYSSVVREHDEAGFSMESYYCGDEPCLNIYKGCHAIKEERSPNGYTRITLLNEQLQPISNIISRTDSQGNFVLSYLDHAETPCPHKDGYYFRQYTLDSRERIVSEYFRDEKDKPCKSNWSGSYGVLYEYDDAQSLRRRIFVDADGKPMMTPKGYGIIEERVDDKNFTIEQRFFDTNGQACINSLGFHRMVERSDRKTHGEKETAYFGVDDQPITDVYGYHRYKTRTSMHDGHEIRECEYHGVGDDRLTKKTKQYDEDGWTVTETSFYDVTGTPCLSRNGWHHYILRSDDHGNGDETFYGVDGKPVNNKRGCHKYVHRIEQKAGRKIIRDSCFDQNGRACRHALCRDHLTVITEDSENKHTSYEYFDEMEKPCCAWGGFARAEFSQDRRVFYDEQGKLCMSIFGYAEARIVSDGGKKKVLFYDEKGELITPHAAPLAGGTRSPRTIQRDYLELSFDADPERYISPVIFSSLTQFDPWAQISPLAGGVEATFSPEITQGNQGYVGTKRFHQPEGTVVAADIGYAQIRRREYKGEKLKSDQDLGYFMDQYLDVNGNPCADAEGCYGRQVYLDVHNRVMEEVYLAKNGARCADRTDGAIAKSFAYNELGLCTQTTLMDPIAGFAYRGYVFKKHYYRWYDRCIETAFFISDELPCRLRTDGVHKVRERFDEQFRLVEQICYDTDERECNNSYGYCRRLIEYTPEGAVVRYVDVDGRPVVPPGSTAGH